MSDIVRLPGGKIITRSRAQALGMLDDAGNLKPDQAPDSAGARIIETARKAAEWAKRQGLPAPAVRVSSNADVAITSDGLIKPVAKIEPLKPSNVDSSGAPITDEATLAAIAAQAAAVEAAKAAGSELTPAQKRAATMAINKAAKEALNAAAAAAAIAAGEAEDAAADESTIAEDETIDAEQAEDITGGPDNGDGTGLSGDAAEVGGTTDEAPADESVSDEATEGQA